jgi:endogenous inhibitor of DNA gyrase (YacG/DUF329 family)
MGGARLCVLCRTRPVDERWRPFCSERCRLLDLARWADGKYQVPGDRSRRRMIHDDDHESRPDD